MKLSIALLSTLSCANAFSLVQNGASRAFMTKLDAQRRQPIMAGAYCKTHDATGRINTWNKDSIYTVPAVSMIDCLTNFNFETLIR